MLLTELPTHLEETLYFPIELEEVRTKIGDVQIEAPDNSDSVTIAEILEPIESDSYDSPDALFNTIFGTVNDDFIGRKFYDDRSPNPKEAEGPRDEKDISF